MTRERIARTFGLIAVVALGLGVYLYQLQIAEHDVWLERSYLNRWAFRDVPTRRGSIHDRHGTPLAVDRPGFDLELRYASFRRRHPAGIVVHAANLITAARGEPRRWRLAADTDFRAAFDVLLGVPLAWLDREGRAWPGAADLLRYADAPGDVGRDVRFYAGALAAALTERTHRVFAVDLARAVAAGGSGTVFDALAPRCARDLGLPEPSSAAQQRALRAALAARLDRAIERLRAVESWLVLERGDLEAAAERPLWSALEGGRRNSGAWRSSRALPEAEQQAIGDPDFWRELAARGLDVPSLDVWWDRFDAAARERLTEAWPERRAELRDALAAELADAALRTARLETRLAQPDLALREPVEAELERAAQRLHTLQRRWHDDQLLPAAAGEQLVVLRDEGRPRLLRAQLPYAVAARIGELQERLPGFLVRTSVLRETGSLPDRDDDLGSFANYLGRVTPYYREDYERMQGRTPEDAAARVFDLVAGSGLLELHDEALPDELEESMQRGAEATLRRHFRTFGRVGRSGVERALDDTLRGTPGLRLIERDRRAREQRMFARFDVRRGRDLRLTVDLRLQALADDVVRDLDGARERALVVLDARSGDILALAGRAELPDPAGGGQRPGWSVGASYPRGNPAIGSVFKPFVALEYLERSARDPEVPPTVTFRPCVQRLRVGNRTFTCSGHHGALSGDVVDALTRSCNMFFYEANRQLGTDLLDAAMVRFGLASADRWPAAWPAGAAPREDVWAQPIDGVLRVLRGQRQQSGLSSYVQAIGYGIDVSALCLARAYAGLATGAVPDIGLVAGDAPRPRHPLGVRREHLELVREGLRGVLAAPGGTGRGIRAELQALGLLDVAHGKTGTARVTAKTERWPSGLDNAWFALFLGADDGASLVVVAAAYRIAGGGGAEAAPMAVDLLRGIAADAGLWDDYIAETRR